MNRALFVGVLLLGLVLIGGAGAWLLAGDPPAVVPAVESDSDVDRAPDRGPPPVVVVRSTPPPATDGPDPGPAADDADEPLPPGTWPWTLPAWWETVNGRLRAGRVGFGREVLLLDDLVGQIGEAADVAVVFGPELESWAADRKHAQPVFTGSAREALDRLAERLNLAVVPEEDRVVLHRRDAVPDRRTARVAAERWALETARARADGEREAPPGGDGLQAGAVTLGFEARPLREVLETLGTLTGRPARCTRDLWDANPPITLAEKGRSLRDLLEAVARAAGARADVTPRALTLVGPSGTE